MRGQSGLYSLGKLADQLAAAVATVEAVTDDATAAVMADTAAAIGSTATGATVGAATGAVSPMAKLQSALARKIPGRAQRS